MFDYELYTLEGEAAVLGSIIVGSDEGSINKVLPILPTEDFFFTDEHKEIFAALLRLHSKNQPTDAVALRTELRSANKLEAIGGVEYIAEVMDSVPSAASAEYYARIVKERKLYRDLVAATDQIRAVIDEGGAASEQVQKAQDIILSLEPFAQEARFCTLAEKATIVAGSMQDKTDVIPTALRALDRIIIGVSPGQICVIAGRTSMGKTALALQIAVNMMQAGKTVLFFTLEMSKESLIERILCNIASVDMAGIKGDDPPQEQLSKLYKVALEQKEQPTALTIYEDANTPEQVAGFIRRAKKVGPVDCVFVDYLQLMDAGCKTENRVQQVSAITKKLRRIAVREQVPIFVLSQLNREVESRENHRPRLSDLRESGTIEQDADLVLLLYRADYYNIVKDPDTTEKNAEAEIIVAKNNLGPTGTAHLIFIDRCTRFGDEDPETTNIEKENVLCNA